MKSRKAVILTISKDQFIDLLQLPHEAEILDFNINFGCLDIFEIKVSGVGYDVQEGNSILYANPPELNKSNGSVKIDWHLPD